MSMEILLGQYLQQTTNFTCVNLHCDSHIDRHADQDSLEYPYEHTDWYSDNHIDN